MNPYKLLKSILPDPPLLVGNVLSVSNGTAIVELPGNVQVQARGEAQIGDRVFIRDNVIEGPAPNLTLEIIEV